MDIKIQKSFLEFDGVPKFIYGGDLSYCRVPRRCWRERISQMRAAGLNTVAFYAVWLYHETCENVYDFEGGRDIASFIDMIGEAGMFCIFRLGPFVHGEFRNGGLPQYLVDKLGPRVRTNDPAYLERAAAWYSRLLDIAEPRLATRGGPVIMMQLENELGSAGCKGDDLPRGSSDPDANRDHLLFYHSLLRERGVDVPLIDINKVADKHRLMPNLVDSGGNYPVNCFSCDGELPPFSTAWWERHERPKITIETGAGMFVRHYDTPAYKHTNGFQGPVVPPSIVEGTIWQQVAEGCSGVNVYIFADGQNPDGCGESMLPARNMNYQAPLSVLGSMRESYRAMKRIGWFLRSFEREILGSEPLESWAKARACGAPFPGVRGGAGDLFDGYGQDAKAESSGAAPVPALARVTTGLNLSESNFLFMRNIANHGATWLRDVRVSVAPAKLASEVFHEYPKKTQMELPPQTMKVMPFFVRLAPGHFLEYSTATLLDRRPFGAMTQVILHATRDEMTETRLVVPDNSPVVTAPGMLAVPDSPNSVTLIAKPGRLPQVAVVGGVRVVLLEQDAAGKVWDVGGEAAVSDCMLAGGRDEVRYRTDSRFLHMELLTGAPPKAEGKFVSLQESYDSGRGLYTMLAEIDPPRREIIFSRRHEGGDLILEADVSPELLEGLDELALLLEFDGEFGSARLDGVLVSDHAYGRFLPWEIGLRDWLRSPGRLEIRCDSARSCDVRCLPIVSGSFRLG